MLKLRGVGCGSLFVGLKILANAGVSVGAAGAWGMVGILLVLLGIVLIGATLIHRPIPKP